MLFNVSFCLKKENQFQNAFLRIIFPYYQTLQINTIGQSIKSLSNLTNGPVFDAFGKIYQLIII